MEWITLTKENIDREHICCSLSDKKGENCVSSKKAWLNSQFENGLIFTKLNVRGKVFIEYIPAEKAWCPINAYNYMHINCLWVSGQFQGKGYSNQLLDLCIQDAKNKKKSGLTILSSTKKKSYLADPNYLKYKGFQVADTASPFFVLYYLPFTKDAPIPQFKPCAKEGKIKEKGMVLYYTNQCPFTAKYAPLIQEIATQYNAELKLIKIEALDSAQIAPTPFTTYSFFNHGQFITHEIFNEKKFIKYLQSEEKL